MHKSLRFNSSKAWLGAVLGGAAYLALNVLIEVVFPDHWVGSPTRLLGLSYAGWSRLLWVPDALFLIGLAGVYRHFSHALGRAGKVGFWLAAMGYGLHILGNIIEFWVFGVFLVPFFGEFTTGSAGSNLGYNISGYGTILLMAGLLIFGFASLRSNLPARWRILLFAVGLIFTSVLFFYFAELLAIHAIFYGLAWMLVGYFFRGEKQ